MFLWNRFCLLSNLPSMRNPYYIKWNPYNRPERWVKIEIGLFLIISPNAHYKSNLITFLPVESLGHWCEIAAWCGDLLIRNLQGQRCYRWMYLELVLSLISWMLLMPGYKKNQKSPGRNILILIFIFYYVITKLYLRAHYKVTYPLSYLLLLTFSL